MSFSLSAIFVLFFSLSNQYTRIDDKNDLGSILSSETDLILELRLFELA